MESAEILSLLDQLDDEIDDLEDSLASVLKTSLSITSSKLPLLDKAKLFVLVTYAIESVLFAYLKLNGVNAREHAVFKELTRVKQYFDKIKTAETPVAAPAASLDKNAARRFIKAGLAGNAQYDLDRAKAQADKRARQRTKFKDLSVTQSPGRGDQPSHITDDSDDGSSSDSAMKAIESPRPEVPPKKRKADMSSLSGSSFPPSGSETSRKKQKRAKKDKAQSKKP